jgi:hypothetical protein
MTDPAIEGIETFARIAPPIWPGKALEVQPGDLTQFAPMGLGLNAPFVMRPWDKLSDMFSRTDYYGYHPRSNDPFRGAPVTDAAGGTVYFDGSPQTEHIGVLLRLMQVGSSHKSYAVFVGRAENPQDEGYLVQLRIVSSFALAQMFGATTGDETTRFLEQPLTVGELVLKFIEHQQNAWGTGFSSRLAGTMGGDGDWAKESLAFGFLVENSYQAVYRIWSRAWLVTK